MIVTIAGNGVYDYAGDGGPATNAALQDVAGIAVDGAGNLFVADQRNNRIRKVSTTGIINTVAGGGGDPAGDGQPAISAQLSSISAVAADSTGIYSSLNARTYGRSPRTESSRRWQAAEPRGMGTADERPLRASCQSVSRWVEREPLLGPQGVTGRHHHNGGRRRERRAG
jgi:hypothetical protein